MMTSDKRPARPCASGGGIARKVVAGRGRVVGLVVKVAVLAVKVGQRRLIRICCSMSLMRIKMVNSAVMSS